MSDEGLVLHIGVDGAGALKEAEKLTKEIGKKLSGVNIDFSGKGGASGIKSAIKKAGSDAAKEIKNQQRIITQVMESGIRASQVALKRVQDRQRVDASRASRGGAFDPMLPFMNPMLSGRGMSGRTRNALQGYKDQLRQQQRERDQLLRQQAADAIRSQREAQKNLERQSRQLQAMNRRAPLNILSQGEVSGDMRATWIADLSRREREQKERYNRESQIQSRLAKDRVRRSFSQQREAEREQRRLARAMESGSRELGSMILDPYGANYTRQGINERAAYVRDAIQKPRLASVEQARRSSYLAERARTERGFRPHGFQGPVPANFQTSRRTQAGVAEMFNKAGVYRAEDMRKQNQFGHRGNMIGMGAYQMQQMFEDYQYAGIRGLGNNMAFMGASIGGGAGMGIIGGALALQIGELTYKMLGYADAQEKAAKASAILTQRQLEFIDVSHDVNARFASGEATAAREFGEKFENPAKKQAREKLTDAAVSSISQGNSPAVRYRLMNDIMANPDRYLDYAAGIGEDVPGMKQGMKDSLRAKQDAENAMKLLQDTEFQEKELRALRQAPPESFNLGMIDEQQKRVKDSRAALEKALAVSHPTLLANIRGKSLTGSGWGDTQQLTDTKSGLQTLIDEMEGKFERSQKRLAESRQRMTTPDGARGIADSVLGQFRDGDISAFNLVEKFISGDKGVAAELHDFESIYEKMKAGQERIEEATKRRRHSVEAIRDAESEADRSVRSQLSNAESMVDAAKRRVQTINEAKTKSGDTFADRAFGINRDRTADFLEKAGASKGYIQYRDDLLVQGRLSQLRGSATAAGKAGDIDRQIEMLQELQNLQLDMASRDPRHGVASGFYNASFATQGEIEAAYQKQASSALTQQQAWQGVVNSLTQAQAIKIDPMSADALPKLQQYIALLESAGQRMAGLNAGNSGVFDPALGGLRGAASGMGVQGWWNQWNANQLLWGGRGGGLGEGQQGPQPKARGGMIDGMGKNDTVNARLMPHEYVIRADVVKRLGAATFEHINRTGTLPRMSSGGYWDLNPYGSGFYERQRGWAQDELRRRRTESLYSQSVGMSGLGGGGRSRMQLSPLEREKFTRIKMRNEMSRRMAEENRANARPRPLQAASAYGVAGGVGGGIGGAAAGYAAKSIRNPNRKASTRRNYSNYGYGGGMGGGFGGGFGGGYVGGGHIGGGYIGGGYFGSGGLDSLGGDYMNAGAFAVAPPLSLISIQSKTGYTYMDTPAYKRWGESALWRPATERWGGSMRGRQKRGFHAFATGGMVQPFAPPAYGGIADIIATAAGRSSGGSAGRVTTNNRSQIGSININVTGSGAVASTINEARRAEHAARLRRG